MKPEVINPDKFYSSEEVTEYLSVSLRTTQRLLKSGQLASFKINGQYRIKGIDLLNYLNNVRYDTLEKEDSTEDKPANLVTMLDVNPISVEISLDLVSLFEPKEDSEILKEINNVRKNIIFELGFIFPGISFKDNQNLTPNTYNILINGSKVDGGKLFLDKLLVKPKIQNENIFKTTAFSGSFDGVTSYWINEENLLLAQEHEYLILKPWEFLIDHLSFLVKFYSHEIISREEVYLMLENLRKTHPISVEEVIQDDPDDLKKISIGKFTKVLKGLLKEQVSIRNMRAIIESLAESIEITNEIDTLIELTRQSLSRQICEKLARNSNEYIIDVFALSEPIEKTFLDSIKIVEQKSVFNFSAIDSNKFINKTKEMKLKNPEVNTIICDVRIRNFIAQILKRKLPQISVLSYQEIGYEYKVNLVAEIRNG